MAKRGVNVIGGSSGGDLVERLHATIAGLESRNADLKGSSEELQSANEGLQAANTDLDLQVRVLERENSDLRNLLESTQIAAIFLDNELRVRSFTPTAAELFHLLETDVGQPIDDLGSRVEYPGLGDDVRTVLTELGAIERDLLSKDGRSYIARVLPYRGVDKFVAGAVITFVDVTSTVRAESALRESEGRLRTILAELQHRVRNTLAVVKSITQRTAESSGSVEEMAAHLNGRFDAFARVQSAVTRNLGGGVVLRALVDDELLAHAAHEGNGLFVEGPDVSLLPSAAESISLALHELTTNAVKHGALANSNSGQIAIRWKFNRTGAGDELSFEWVERRSDGPIPRPERHGFGMELLTRILPYDLGASTSMEFRDDGLCFAMELPREHIAE